MAVNKNLVYKLAKTLPSYSEVGRQLGISRERVRQICLNSVWNPQSEGYIPLAWTTSYFKYSRSGLYKIVLKGALPYIKHKGRIYVKMQELNLGFCRICGELIKEKKRFIYCSEECCKSGTAESHKRASFRSFHKKMRQNINTPYLALRPNRAKRTYIK